MGIIPRFDSNIEEDYKAHRAIIVRVNESYAISVTEFPLNAKWLAEKMGVSFDAKLIRRERPFFSFSHFNVFMITIYGLPWDIDEYDKAVRMLIKR